MNIRQKVTLDKYKEYVKIASFIAQDLLDEKVINGVQQNIVFQQIIALLLDDRLSGYIHSVIDDNDERVEKHEQTKKSKTTNTNSKRND